MSPLVPQKYSERLGVIDPDQLFEVAEQFDLGDVLEAEAASTGLFGQNLFLTTSEGRFVLRGNPHGPQQLTKERVVAQIIDERSSLPAPWPYDICEDTSTFGWPYAIMPWLEGETGAVLFETQDEEGKIDLAAAHGEALARLHEATNPFFGPYDGQLDNFVQMDDFGDWTLHRLEHWRNLCRAVNALPTEAERYIDELIERHSPALKEPFTPVLVHHDFTLGNVNFHADDFEPAGVFDLMEAYFGDPEEDIVRMLWQFDREQREAFVDEYHEGEGFRPGAKDRLALYAICDWLVIWEYGSRIAGWFEDASFIERAVKIVRNAQAIGG
jgi:aminoglycoside phosphotransferase (APT) family kinase protein